MTIKNCAMGFPSSKGLVSSWAMAQTFSSDEGQNSGQLASAVDIIDLRLELPSTSPIWHHWWTTTSSEFYGLSPAGRPVVAVLHGTGPLASLRGPEGAMEAYSWEYKDKAGDRRGGRVSRKTFHEILDGRHGSVLVSDFTEETASLSFPGDGRSSVDIARALRSNWIVARLGGYERAERYLQAVLERGVDEPKSGEWDGRDDALARVRRQPVFACVQSDHAPFWEYVFTDRTDGSTKVSFKPSLKDIDGDRVLAGLLVVEPVRRAREEKSDRTHLETGMSVQDWTDSAKFLGIRGEARSVHCFEIEDAIDEERDLTTVDFREADGFHALMYTDAGELVVQYPKKGCTGDSVTPMCGVLDATELSSTVFTPEIRPYLSFDYALKEIVRIAPPGANAYLLNRVAENGRTAEVTFYRVVADMTRRRMRPAELESDVPLVAELAERQVLRERGQAEIHRKVRVDAATTELVSAFWALPMSSRRCVCEKLDLLDGGEMRMPEGQRYCLAFARAGEMGVTRRMMEEIRRLAV